LNWAAVEAGPPSITAEAPVPGPGRQWRSQPGFFVGPTRRTTVWFSHLRRNILARRGSREEPDSRRGPLSFGLERGAPRITGVSPAVRWPAKSGNRCPSWRIRADYLVVSQARNVQPAPSGPRAHGAVRALSLGFSTSAKPPSPAPPPSLPRFFPRSSEPSTCRQAARNHLKQQKIKKLFPAPPNTVRNMCILPRWRDFDVPTHPRWKRLFIHIRGGSPDDQTPTKNKPTTHNPQTPRRQSRVRNRLLFALDLIYRTLLSLSDDLRTNWPFAPGIPTPPRSPATHPGYWYERAPSRFLTPNPSQGRRKRPCASSHPLAGGPE